MIIDAKNRPKRTKMELKKVSQLRIKIANLPDQRHKRLLVCDTRWFLARSIVFGFRLEPGKCKTSKAAIEGRPAWHFLTLLFDWDLGSFLEIYGMASSKKVTKYPPTNRKGVAEKLGPSISSFMVTLGRKRTLNIKKHTDLRYCTVW